jgi:hypothetical protein
MEKEMSLIEEHYNSQRLNRRVPVQVLRVSLVFNFTFRLFEIKT